MHKLYTLCTLCLALILSFANQAAQAQVSPWGTGAVNNLTLGQLTGQSVYVSHTNDVVPYTYDLNNYLANYTYNIYVPPSYDGTTAYGVVTFINSGNTGAIPASWLTVLDERRLILVAGNNIGNSVAVVTRIGVALAGSEIMKETLNIDTTRVYASGNSGGARSCAGLMFFFPEKYTGMLANCGSSYLRLVDQDYETFQPDSHYEYGIFQYNQTHLDYVYSFDHKYSMLTSFDDFREGDIMNIYHNGMEPDGFKSKILEIAGAHCTTSSQHFRDAINFVEHPHIDLVRDSFAAQPYAGTGFQLQDASLVNQELVFDHNSANEARAYSNDPIVWNTEKGAIIRTTVALDSVTYNQNSVFNIGLLDLVQPQVVTEDVGHELYDSIPNLLLSITFDNAQPMLSVLAENPSGNVYNDTLFKGAFTDWSSNEPLQIKYHIWNQEVRIELGSHLDPNSYVNGMSKLLDDNRSIRIRTDANYWLSSDFTEGAMLTFYAGKLNNALPSTTINVAFVEVIVADTLICNPIVNTIADVQSACGSYQWIDGNTYTASNSTATYGLTTAAGCDSLIVLNLTINNPTTGTDVQSACEPYTWIDGNTYSSDNNTATWALTNAAGCDSIVTLDLTINTADASITSTTPTELMAVAVGAQYQWLDCDNGYAPIVGETNQNFTATSNGNFAVEVIENGCVDTSTCINVTGIWVAESDLNEPQVSVYPNPTNGNLTVDLHEINSAEIIIIDMLGREVNRVAVSGDQLVILDLDGPAGVYFVEVVRSSGVRTAVRVVKR